MAGRKRGTLETAEKDLWFTFTSAGTYYIDIAQCLSLVNRRFYRQGMQYALADMEMNADGVVTNLVYRLPETWVVASAWEKIMRHWLAQQDDAMDNAGLESTVARYRDFKVSLDLDHGSAGFGVNAVPDGVRNLAALPATANYEWQESNLVIPNVGGPGVTVERPLHFIGGDQALTTGSVGMIKAYAESRSRPFPEDPNIVDVNSGGILGKMDDVGDNLEDIINNVQGENDITPYVIGDVDSAVEYYPGGSEWAVTPRAHIETIMTIRNTAPIGGIFHTTYAPGFLASCGLLRLDIAYPDAENQPSAIFFKLGLAAGNYKGVAARSMVVVN